MIVPAFQKHILFLENSPCDPGNKYFFREENSVFQSSLLLCHSLEFLCDIRNKSIPRDWKVWKFLVTCARGKVWWGENQSPSHSCSHLLCESHEILKHMEFLQQHFSTYAHCCSAHYDMKMTHHFFKLVRTALQVSGQFQILVYNMENRHLFLVKMNVQAGGLGKELSTSFVCERERGRLKLGKGGETWEASP